MSGKTRYIAFSVLFSIIASTSVMLSTAGAVQASSSSLTSTISGGANPEFIWEKTFGGMGDDRAFHIAAVADGYLIVGSSTSQTRNLTAAWVLKLTNRGEVVWNRTYLESAGSEFRYAMSLDDGFLLVGNVFHPSGDQDGFAVKIAEDGTPLWKVALGGAEVDKLFSASRTDDGGLIFAGLTNSFGAGNSDVWAVKVDAKGTPTWNKTYGGELDEAGRGIASSGDDLFVIGGYTNSIGNGDYDFLVLEIDESGKLLWNRTYGGLGSDKAYAVTASDGVYAIAGDTQSQGAGNSDAWVIKVDSNGKLVWQKTLGGEDFDSVACITATKNGSFLVGGFTLSFGNGMRDMWLSKIDSDGSVHWSFTLGRKGYEEAYGVVEAEGQEVVLTGWTDFTGQGRYDYYVAALEIELTPANSDLWLVYVVLVLGGLFLAFSAFMGRHRNGIRRN